MTKLDLSQMPDDDLLEIIFAHPKTPEASAAEKELTRRDAEKTLPEILENPDPEKIADWVISTRKVFEILFATRKELELYRFRVYNIRKTVKRMRLATKLTQLSDIEQIRMISRDKTLYLCPPDYVKIPEQFITCASLTQDELDKRLQKPRHPQAPKAPQHSNKRTPSNAK